MKIVKNQSRWGLPAVCLIAFLIPANAVGTPSNSQLIPTPPLTAVTPAAPVPIPPSAPQLAQTLVEPSCGNPCTKQNADAATQYAIEMINKNRTSEALLYMKSCQRSCPRYSCQLTALYARIEGLLLQKYVANKEIRQASSQCREFALVEIGTTDNFADSTPLDKETMEKVNQVWRKAYKPIWTGYALLGIGVAVTVTSAVLMGMAANNQLPHPGDCGSQSGVRGDPCIVDFSRPAAKAALGIPLALGLGSMVAGATLLITF